MKKVYNLFTFFVLLVLPSIAFSDAGVLIPTGFNNVPNDSILSIEKMDVYIDVNNQYADVKIIQIYKNHRERQLEGQYIFTMPEGAKISDFAIWEDLVRIPGVIMEKKKAREIYEEITRARIDPGLLESTDVQSVVNKFSCKVFPIPPYGTKRIEMNYKMDLKINDLKTYFILPLKPELYGSQRVGDFYLNIKIASKYPMKNFMVKSNDMPINLESADNLIKGELSLQNHSFNEDFIFTYEIDVKDVFYDILTHRDVKKVYADISPANGRNYQDDSGYFLLKAIFNYQSENANGGNRNIVFVLDASLSMLFDKLDRAYETLQYFLGRLGETDKFTVVIFNDKVSFLSNGLLPATAQNVQATKDFVDKSYISGGTNITLPFKESFELLKEPGNNYIVFISDGYPTLGKLELNSIKKEIKELNRNSTKIFPFGIGDDTNKYFFEELALENNGAFNFVASTETNMIYQEIFFNKIGALFIENLNLAFGANNVYDIYPLEPINLFNKTSIDYVGKYKNASKEDFKLNGYYNGAPFKYGVSYELPEENKDNEHIRRMWAEKRVEYLLKRIHYESEKKEWVDEIIELAKQFKFVTPYTSFLAAPRSVLRPRVIKPGDPVLKVKTDESIVEVIAVFPFGLTKNMEYNKDEDVFKTRFLIPANVKDGEYACRLILKDRYGNVYKESKEYVVDSFAPVIRAEIKGEVSAGEIVKIKVYTDKDTKLLNAKFPYATLVSLKYDDVEKASIGYLRVYDKMESGSYKLKITATDFAHNSSVKEVEIRVKSL